MSIRRRFCLLQALCLAFVLGNSATILAQATRTGVPAGFVNCGIEAESQRLSSIPFVPFGSNLDSQVGAQMSGATTQSAADKVVKWDASAQSYVTAWRCAGTGDESKDGHWLDSSGAVSTMSLSPGDAFWLQNLTAQQLRVTLCGKLPLDASRTVTLLPSMNLFSYPYASKIGLNSTSLRSGGAQGAASQELGPDTINKVSPDASFWLKSLSGDALDGMWLDSSNALSNEYLKIGKGYWYSRAASTSFNWVESIPYSNVFDSSSSSPQISAMEKTPDGAGMTLTISCSGSSGETLEIFYKDLSENAVLETASGWQLLARGMASGGQTSVTYTDASAVDNATLGRLYVVCRQDVDTDGDGASDAEEALVYGTSGTDAASGPNSLLGYWTASQDIGTSLSGTTLYGDGTYTITGAGSDIWNSSDGFRFLHTALYGDCVITARVTAISNTNGWAKAGVMIRNSLAANSRHASMLMTFSNGTTFQRRLTDGGGSSSVTGSTTDSFPMWVRLAKSGNSVSAYRSSDGTTWIQVGSTTTIAMDSPCYAGLAISSHNAGALCQATFDNVTVSMPVPTPALSQVAGTVGQVSIACPLSGAAIRYTTDGGEPVESSPLYIEPFQVSNTVLVKAKAFKTGYSPSATASAAFSPDYVQGIAGLYYAKYINPLTGIDSATPGTGEVSSQINYALSSGNFAASGLATYVSASFRGALYIPEAGTYTFHLSSDDYSRMLLDGSEAIAGVSNGKDGSASLSLTAGLHALRVDFAQGSGSNKLILQWESSSITKQAIPAGFLLSADPSRRGYAEELRRFIDSDGDGFDDYNETYKYGTDPALASSNPAVLPSSWTGTCDIAASATGYSLHYNSQYELSATGSDIGGASDSLRFIYSTAYGDCSVVARVASMNASKDWAKAGVMIRDGLGSGARSAATLISSSRGSLFERRPYPGTGSAMSYGSGVAPCWVKIERRGDAVTGSVSADGSTWTSIGSGSFASSLPLYIGLAVSSYTDAAACTAIFDNVSLSKTVPAPAISPWGASYRSSQSVSLSCVDGTAAIRYTLDGSEPGSSSTLYSAPLQLSGGTVCLKAKAFLDGEVESSVSQAVFTNEYVPGLTSKYYSGCISPLSSLDQATPYASSMTPFLNYLSNSGVFAGSGLATGVSASFSGSLYVPADGSYTFYLSSNDASRLLLDGEIAIDGVSYGNDKSATLSLTKGMHPLRVDFNQNMGSSKLVLEWEGSGISKQSIPSSNLFSSDTDSDGQSDAWETYKYGDLTSSDGSGDLDGDAFTDAAELSTFLSKPDDASSVPYAAQSVSGAVSGLVAAYYQGTFLKIPDFTGLRPFLAASVPDIKWLSFQGAMPPCELSTYFAAKLSGYIEAPSAGLYQLFLTCDDAADLYIDEVKTLSSTCTSAALPLSAGLHSIRLEYYQTYAYNCLTLEWIPPGGKREYVPASRYFHTEGQLASETESLDSDMDGVSDSQEDAYAAAQEALLFSGSVEAVSSVEGSAISSSSGTWVSDSGGIYCLDRNGWVEYSVSVPSGGNYMLAVTGTQHNPISSASSFNLSATLDGVSLGSRTLEAAYGSSGSVSFFMPHVEAGAHTARITWGNVDGNTSLKIISVQVATATSDDSDSNGVADWVDAKLASIANVTVPAASAVSPICVEGADSSFIETLSISGFYTPDGEDPLAPVPFKGPSNSWFVDVPISPDAQSSITFDFHGIDTSVIKAVSWTPTDILASNGSTIMLRKGDSLLLKAGAPSLGAVSISVGETQLSLGEGKSAIPFKFESAGDFQVSASYTPNGGAVQTGSITVRAIQAVFTSNPVCVLKTQRAWNSQTLPPEAVLETDPHLEIGEAQSGGSTRNLTLFLGQLKDASIVARLGEGGPVMAHCAVTALDYATSKESSYYLTVETYADGSSLVEGYVSLSDLADGVSVVIRITTSGVTFDDGTTTRTITAADFDENGVYSFRLLASARASSSVCHSFTIYQDNAQISTGVE